MSLAAATRRCFRLEACLLIAVLVGCLQRPVVAQSAAAAPEPALAIDELAANPSLDDGAAGWELLRARALADLGPDDGPAVQLDRRPGDKDEWASLTAHITAPPVGLRVTLSVRAESLGPDQNLWLGAWAYTDNAEMSAWQELDHWQVQRDLALGAWRDLSLSFTIPPATRVLDLRLTASHDQPVLVADVHLRPSVRGMPRAAGDTAADVSCADLEALARRSRAAVVGIRQAAFTRPPPVRLIERRCMRTYIERDVHWSEGKTLSDEEAALRLLGLWPATDELENATVDAMGATVAGTYDPSTHAVLLAADMPRDILGVAMVHEMTHALDDQQHGLWTGLAAATMSRHGDQDLAWGCVVEGSAVLTQLACLPSDPAGERALASKERSMAQAFTEPDVPELLRRRLVAPYVLGVRFLTRGRGYAAGDSIDLADLARALDDPPVSTEQILHPEKYWSDGPRDLPRRIDLPDASTVLGAGWTLAAHDTLGELQLGMLTGLPRPDTLSFAHQPPAGWTHAPTSGWGSDEWQLYTCGNDAVVILATTWDTPADAAEFSAAVRCPPHGLVQRAHDVVAIVVDGRGPDAAQQPGDQALIDAVIAAIPPHP